MDSANNLRNLVGSFDYTKKCNKEKKGNGERTILKRLHKRIKPYLTPKMIIVFGGIWLLTTGWVHAFVIIGSIYKIGWLAKLGWTIEIVIWNPFVNEKLITIPFSVWLYKKIFKKDIQEIKKER